MDISNVFFYHWGSRYIQKENKLHENRTLKRFQTDKKKYWDQINISNENNLLWFDYNEIDCAKVVWIPVLNQSLQ